MRQVIDETFETKRSKAGMTSKDCSRMCEHVDMCPIASTAKVKRWCQENKGDSSDPLMDTRPCVSEGGFWGCIRKLFGMQVALFFP